MKIDRIYSYYNGFEFLIVRKKKLWMEIQDLISNATADKRLIKTQEQKTSLRDSFKSSFTLKSKFHRMLKAGNWRNTPQNYWIASRVGLEVQFGKYAFVAYDLFVKHLAFYVGNQIDVGIEILPMKTLQQQMSSGVPYYEGELYNVIRQGRGVPAVPLVIIGVDK